MAGEASSSSSTSKKKSKLVRQESGKCSELESDKCAAGSSAQTTRGGLRVYKIVVLGDGGVGKSGILKQHFNNRYFLMLYSITAVTLQFVSHSFLDYHDPTIGKTGTFN